MQRYDIWLYWSGQYVFIWATSRHIAIATAQAIWPPREFEDIPF